MISAEGESACGGKDMIFNAFLEDGLHPE